MNRRDWLKAALSLGAIALVAGTTSAAAAPAADLPAEGTVDAQGRGHGGGGGGFGGGPGWGGGRPPGQARGWGGGNSRWAATRGRKRGWYRPRWRRGW
jgi:hypothetical protein